MNLHEHASVISQTYEIGEIVGGLVLGTLNDKFHKK
jgi:sugar phosphate permease